MATPPNKPIDAYPPVAPTEQPVLPPVDPDGAVPVPPAADAEQAAPLPVERLAFRPGAKPLSEDVLLDWPFEWQGRVVDRVTVRRLTVAEVGDLADSGDLQRLGMWAFYAAQTGLPAGVLRGLIEDDGDRVTDANRRFLPSAFAATLTRLDDAAISSSPTTTSGEPTSPA